MTGRVVRWKECDWMLQCTSGQLKETMKGGQKYYRIRLHLVDDTAKERKDRYRDKYLDTGLVVGGKTGRISNFNLANEMLTQAIREYTPVGANMPFNKYCEYWIDEIKSNHDLSITTKEGYEYKTGYITRYFQDSGLTLSDVSTNDLRNFMNSLYEIENKKNKDEEGLSDRTVRDIMVIAKQIFKFAIDNGHLRGANPSANVKLPKKKKKEDDLPYISDEDIQDFKELLHANCDGHLMLEYAFLIGLFYGLRREEICGLKWSAIRNGDIHIEHTVVRMKTLVAKDTTKSDASNRACAILPEIQEIFDQIKAEQEKNKSLYGNTYHDSDYIFTWEDGRTFTPDYLSKKFRKIIDKSETLDKRLHLHDLRVSCVSILINKGINIKDVQKWVGHTDIHTTMNIYARTTRKRQYETGQAMASVLF